MRISDWSSDVCSSDLSAKGVGVYTDGSGSYSAGVAYVTQVGEDNTSGVTQSGASNFAFINQGASGNDSTVLQTGEATVANVSQTGSGNSSELDRKSTRLNSSH